MKTLLLSILMLFSIIQTLKSQTTLTAGDIAIIGYNSDDIGGNDDFTFILLIDISSGTNINFTDFGWCSGVDITGFQSHNPCGANTGAYSDGAIRWTATSDLNCGTQIRIQCKTTLTATTGNVSGVLAGIANPMATEYINLVTGGDQLFAYQGTLSSPTLITGMNMNGAWDASLSQCAFTPSQSTLPSALSSANSIAITPEIDNARYNSVDTANSPLNLRSAIFNVANWNVDNTTPFTFPIPNSFGCAVVLPVIWSSQPTLSLLNKNIVINWSTASEVNNYKYIIEQSMDAINFVNIGEIVIDNHYSLEKKYSFTHQTPSFGLNYYRIKQIDYDGKYSYSSLVSKFYNEKDRNIIIYPNPAKEEVVLNVSEETKITILDMKGKIVKKQIINPENNKVDVSELIEGVYIITFESNNRLRFIKN